MSRTAVYILAYDIADDRERLGVERLLLGYGFRRQKSVFECRLTSGARAALFRQLQALELKTGFVLAYRVSHASRPQSFGAAPEHFPDDGYAFLV